ncbi:hypothetical protein D3C76_658100 [compost metagenome]
MPGAVLNVAGVLESAVQLADVRGQTLVAMTIAQLAEQRIEHTRLLGQGSQHIEALHVAGTFPSRVHRSLAVQAWQDAVFDVSRPTHAFGGFVDHGRRALADPVLAHGRHQPGKLRFLCVIQMIQRPAHAQAQGQGGFAFQCQVRQHVLHQGLFAEQLAAHLAVGAVMAGLGQCLAHQRA